MVITPSDVIWELVMDDDGECDDYDGDDAFSLCYRPQNIHHRMGKITMTKPVQNSRLQTI